jgi:uncharacterized protein (TIGR02058 family)
MSMRRMVLEIGTGTDIRGVDPTKAAVRALRNALWRNSLGLTQALGLDSDAMEVAVTIGVPYPEQVDHQAVLDILPHGTGTVRVVAGGLEIPNPMSGGATLLAHAAAEVFIDVVEGAR